MPIRLPPSANGRSPARRTPAALQVHQASAKDHFRRRSRERAYSRRKDEANKGLAVLLSGRPSPLSVRAPSFGESLRHLPKARKPPNRGERDVAEPRFPFRYYAASASFPSAAGRTPANVGAPNRDLAPCRVAR
ncbi:hypothetical protein MTO96_037337 [Rhipicephalus appendiculatus]